MVHVAQNLDTGIPRMSDTVLSEKDLPLGTLLPDAEYNQLLATAIASTTAGQALSNDEISRLEQARQTIWSQLTALKSQGNLEV